MSNLQTSGLYVKTTVNDVFLPDAPFPPSYLPASNFQVTSDLTHCTIPWYVATDAFSAFELSGGVSGTLVGSLNGIQGAQTANDINSQMGVFATFGNNIGPRFGYCISDKFKQHVYVRFDITNDPLRGAVILLYYGIELLENGSFNRIYVKEGEVQSYNVIKGEKILSLGITKTTPPPKGITVGGTISVSNSAGKSISLKVNSIKDNWDIVVSSSSNAVPETGDYYSLNETWCIEDPYLLTGYWKGTENQVSTSSSNPTSGLNLYVTEQNSPYEESYITGVYIWKSKTNSVSTTTTTLIQPIQGTNMADTTDATWAFYGYGNSKQYSDTYANDVRYKETTLVSNVASASISSNVNSSVITRTIATDIDLNALLSSKPPTEYLRLELGRGGYYTRNNWHAPCLKGSYLKINDSKFKIMEHVESDIVDVAMTSVDGKKISLNNSTKYSLLNQWAWTITENYYELPTGQRKGIMEGQVTSVSGKVVVINIQNDPLITTGTKGGLSLKTRYQTDISLGSNLKKLFSKNDNWRLLDSGSDSEYFIDTITYDKPASDGSYNINVTLKDISTITVGKTVWFAFGSTYDTLQGKQNYFKKNGYLFDLTVKGGNSGNVIGKLFIVSDVLCIDGSYISNYYKTNVVGNNVRVGVCDGLEFGIEANGSALNRMGAYMFIKAAIFGRGIASLFHTLRNEGWVTYQDAETGNLNTRRGVLDFKELPTKSEVAIGKPVSIANATVSGSQIMLDGLKERLRRLTIKLPTSDKKGPSIMFGIGDSKSPYGFLISGDGLVDLLTLEYQGVGEGDINSSTYVDSSNLPVSPVYIYDKGPIQFVDYIDVDMGIDTGSSIYVKDTKTQNPVSISEASAQYINNNQVLQSNGLFDIIREPDGEVFLIYGQTTSGFKFVNGQINNSSTNNSTWTNSGAIYIIGSPNDSHFWGTPTAMKYGEVNSSGIVNENQYQYPIMLLNSVDYLSSIYNPISSSLSIFVNAESNGSKYVGCFTVAISSLINNIGLCADENYNASSPSESPLKFYYRPQLLDKSFISDTSKSWIDSSSDIITSSFDYAKVKKPSPQDSYVRVLGTGDTNSQISRNGDFSMISTSVLPDGTYMLLYNDITGVKAIFSTSQGQFWIDSNIIMARNANSGVALGDCLFYITSDGIMVKQTPVTYFLSAMKKEGNQASTQEKQIQELFDTATTTLISGAIDIQRLSGYITSENYYRLFYYDQNDRLNCIGSSNGRVWGAIDNF